MTTTLMTIESLLNEFHHPNTQNWRKRQIETELISYKNQTNSWQQSICNLQNFSNQFLWFFNTSTIEHTIVRRWSTLLENDRITLRKALWTTYANFTNDIPTNKRNTIAQLIAIMGKREFPDDHPDYMNHILEIIKNKFTLGIVLLRITSEEVMSSKEDISSDRKKYFQSCLSLCMPQFMDLLGKYLAITVCRLNGTDFRLIPNNFIDPALNDSLPNDNHLSTAIIELLSCVQHLFLWVPLENLSDYFLFNLFDIAKWKSEQCDISIAALTTINELFYIQRSIPLPETLTTGIKEILEKNILTKSNEMYQDKLTELLRLYMTKYWSKLIEDEEMCPRILIALYQYTFLGYGALAFTERLEIWSPLLKGLAPVSFRQYAEIAPILVNGILRKMQFRFDQEQELDTLDNESLDDNMETEWQHYLTQCIETIALIAEGCPKEVLEQVFYDWQKPFEIFLSLEKAIDTNTLELNDQPKCHFIHCTLRDLSSMCQTLVRLAPILEGCSNKYPENILQITHGLVYTVKNFSCKKFDYLNLENSILSTDFNEFFAQTLSALRSLLICSPALKSENELKHLIENVGQILLTYTQQESRIVTLAAAQLLLSISTVIRPKYMLECHSIIQLVQAGPVLPHLSRQVIITTHQFIINCLVLPWHNINNQCQDFEKRTLLLQQYINCITKEFLVLDLNALNNGQVSKFITITMSTLPILKEILDYFKESSSTVKSILTNSFKNIITKSLSIYNVYAATSNEISNSVSDFILSVLKTLQIQLGSSFVKDILTIFLESSTRDHLTSCQVQTIEKILQMMLLVVEQPGASTFSLIPAILKLSLDHILPLLSNEKNSVNFAEISFNLYSLFDGILQHRWQYFYKSQVLRGFSPGASDFSSPTDEVPQHSDQLLTILTTYGRAIVDKNYPHITRFVLISLQSLNEKWKLYHRDFFEDNLLISFQCALIKALISSEGALQFDLLLDVLFSMGQVNVSKLHEAFVSIGYQAESKILRDICCATDLPTFSSNMNLLIQDTRCLQLSQ